MLERPKVSIIIPVYNGSNYLKNAIDSALVQTYPNLEIVVVNDGSCDEGATRDVALSYGDKITYYEKENGRVASALNMGIEKMTGEYFSWLSHDDEYYPEKISRQVKLVQDSPPRSIIYSDFSVIDTESKLMYNYKIPFGLQRNFQLNLICNANINGCTLLIPKVCFEELGVFNESLRMVQDYDLWFRFSEKFNFVHLREYLIKSRTHPNQGAVSLRSICNLEENHFISTKFYNLSEGNIYKYFHIATKFLIMMTIRRKRSVCLIIYGDLKKKVSKHIFASMTFLPLVLCYNFAVVVSRFVYIKLFRLLSK